jgi:hypothetical protein
MALNLLQSLVQRSAPCVGARRTVREGKSFVVASDLPVHLSCLRHPLGRYPQDTRPATERRSMRFAGTGAIGAGRSLRLMGVSGTSTMRPILLGWPASPATGKARRAIAGGRFWGNAAANTKPAQPALRFGARPRTAALAG